MITSPPESSPSWLLPQLAHALGRRASEHSAVWTMFSLFMAATGVLANAVFGAAQLDFTTFAAQDRTLVLALLGAALCTVWRFVQARALAYLGHYEDLARRIEGLLEIPDEFTIAPHKLAQKHPDVEYSVRGLMQQTVITLQTIWCCLAIFSAAMILSD